MGFWKKFTGFLGFGPDENSMEDDIDHRKGGFSAPVQVPAHPTGPVLIPSPTGDGGIQGLGWYAKRLRVDEDGDVADEFLEEVFQETTSSNTQHNQFQNPTIQVKLNTKPAKARNPVLTREGTIQQFVEYRGRFLLV